ncbi:MAG: TonB-dependent receptor [Gammaproteobacteria bacterium]|jgi:iron complex outermembrane receptor protein|nr:TonB-dependent receptor [Gammaproteobacteria bacterium]
MKQKLLARGALVPRLLLTGPALSLIVAGSFSYALPAGAQESAPDEITVFARRRSESVKDVPATVTVFTENDIARSNINRASEIALLTPGVSLVDTAEVGDTQVNIRGMNGARDSENSYALVIDGITYTNPAALNREYANLAQIEVLKGPQGAIYGRNASAGAFIIQTKEPGEELEGQVFASYGQDDTYSLTGAAGGRLTSKLRGSVQGEYFRTDGFFKNEFLGRDDVIDNQEIKAISGRLIYELSDATTIDAKLRYGEVDAGSIVFNNVFNIRDLVGGLGPAVYQNVNDQQFRFYNNVIQTNEQESTEFSVKLDHEMDWASLTAWGLYSDIENQLGADGTSAAFGFFAGETSCQQSTAALTGFPLNAPQFIGQNPNSAVLDPNGSLFGAYTPTTCDGTQFQRRNQKDFSFEARLTSNGDGPLQWMGGVYFLTIDREVAVGTGIDNINAPSFAGGTVVQQPFVANGPGVINPTEQLVWDQFDTDVYSIFGSIGYDFTDTLTADLALRYDNEKRKVRSLVPGPDVANPSFIDPCIPFAVPTPGVTPINPGLCNGPIDPKSRTFSQFQPKLSVKWDVLDELTLFTSYGVGFRSGGFNNQGSQATVDTFINDLLNLCDPAVPGCVESGRSRVGILDEYDKETSNAFELGFKSTVFDNKLRLEGAAYYTEVDDMQFFEFVVGPFGLLRVVENIDEVEIFGIELGANWEATDWLDLYAAMNWTESEIKANTARPDTVGNESPYTPDYTANFGGYLDFPVTDDYNFFTNLDVSVVGQTWFSVVQKQERPIGFELLIPGIQGGNYAITERDRYAITNLRVGLESDQLTLALWVNNLFDERYLEEVIPAPEFGGSFVAPGNLRRAGFDVTYRF